MNEKFTFSLGNIEEIIASIFLIITTALVILNIVMRYFLNSGIIWSEEVATGCFVWSVFIGAIAAFKHRGHVGVDILVKLLPPTARWGVNLLMDMILVLLNGYMAYLAIMYVMITHTKMTPVLGLSSAYISSAVPIAFVMMTFYALRFVWQDINLRKETVK